MSGAATGVGAPASAPPDRVGKTVCAITRPATHVELGGAGEPRAVA
jgi:hypothetical protein